MSYPSFFILFRIISILQNNKLSEYFSIPILPIPLSSVFIFNFEHVIRYVQSQQLKAWMNEMGVSIVNNKDTTTKSNNAQRCPYC